jgi:hypothetical protein
MFEILARHMELTSGELSELFAIACSTVKRLEQDEGVTKAAKVCLSREHAHAARHCLRPSSGRTLFTEGGVDVS